MITRWVQRNGLGVVVAHFGCRQPGFAEEEIDADHPDLIAFHAPKPAEIRRELDEAEAMEARQDAQIQSDLNMTPTEVNSTVDTLFAGFTGPQRTFLKRLVRMVLAAARKVLR